MIPAFKLFIKKHNVEQFVVVADAAMISTDNVAAPKVENINYILVARLGNVVAELLAAINAQLQRADSIFIRLKTDNGYLIHSYSKSRYNKDKYEL